MATFQVCQPTGWTWLVVAWAVVRSVAGFVDASPTSGDYLGGVCLPSRVRLVFETFHYVDTHRLPLCGLTQNGSVVLPVSDSLAPHSLHGLRMGVQQESALPWRGLRCLCWTCVRQTQRHRGAECLPQQRDQMTRRLCGRSAH